MSTSTRVRPLAEAPAPAQPPTVVYADLDGTLLGPGGSLFSTAGGDWTLRAARAIQALHQAGVRLVLVSGRGRPGMLEARRMLGATAYVAELGAIIVEGSHLDEKVTTNFGAFAGEGAPYDEMVRSGVGALLLERYRGRLELHAPWSTLRREATILYRGNVDPAEASAFLAGAGYPWLELHDNGRIAGAFPGLDVEEVHAFHLTPKGVTKAAGVALHRERNSLARETTVMVGDAVSDLEVAPEVAAVFLVGNSALPEDAPIFDNAWLTPGRHGDGFADAVAYVLGTEL